MVQSKAKTVAQYLKELPADRRDAREGCAAGAMALLRSKMRVSLKTDRPAGGA